jgi:hypothetical protein
MAEINPDASFLIATSWQALKRAETGDERTMMTNCTVIIIFAGFFIEANLNHIIAEMGKVEDVSRFAGGGNPGLGAKLAWFYESFISKQELSTKKQIYEAMWQDFPEAEEIIEFRNKVSHGEIDREVANLEDAKRLRLSAKKLVDRLIDEAKEAGHPMERGTTYKLAIGSSDLTNEVGGP